MSEKLIQNNLSLLAYEKLSDHGFALPLYASSKSANALHVAVPSKKAEPESSIIGFEIYSPASVEPIERQLWREYVEIGSEWVDVFVWNERTFVGTKSEIWQKTASIRGAIEEAAPLSLLVLAEAIQDTSVNKLATVATQWLTKHWGDKVAVQWQVNTYLRNQLRRDLFEKGLPEFTSERSKISLRLYNSNLRLGFMSPHLSKLSSEDLPNLVLAAANFGMNLHIERDNQTDKRALSTRDKRDLLLMRLRRGRGNTQTQIPFTVADEFFGGDTSIKQRHGRRTTSLRLSKSFGRRNTVKLQLPEMVTMEDPVIRFEKRDGELTYEIFDATTKEGSVILSALKAGIEDGSTRTTRGGATWWRLM